ncbi:MAG: modification methylase, partial [Gammaproteobacteria bacterium]|nr:modification methylase [Gammaproteobacteria bacterium]
FSLFREFVDLLTVHDKQFLVVGNMNAVTYKDVFKHIKEDNLWLGINPVKEFTTPEGGIKKFGNILWFTNMSHKKRNEKLFLVERYSEDKYPVYDNYNAIEVSKVKNIPEDYYDLMGVPITFLTKYNPEQFELLGYNRYLGIKALFIKGKEKYDRIIIKRKQKEL